MVRVAKVGVLISDSNCYGQGSVLMKIAKHALWRCGLWRAADFVRTRGKGYQFNEKDGVFYSYSVLDSLDLVKAKFPNLYFLTGQPTGSAWLPFSARGIAVLATV